MRLVVCHDAGGAEIVSSWLRRHGDADYACVLEGPARHVFERKLGAVPETSLAQGIVDADSLLCGTSWQSTLEFEAIGAARRRGLPSAAFLDHWINYTERFQHEGETRLPDELWVGDDFARDRAEAEFPGSPVRLVGNPFLEDIREEVAKLPLRAGTGALSLLYVSEPVSEFGHMPGDPSGVGYDEHQALAFCLQRLDRLDPRIARVVVRPHPSEPAGKYDWAIGFRGLPVSLGGRAPLLEEIAGSDIVAGVESMAMVIGLLAGKRVLSCIPPGGRPCVLPFPEIERLG